MEPIFCSVSAPRPVAGMLLGVNRDLQNKPIGTRTLGLVALGTAARRGVDDPVSRAWPKIRMPRAA